MKKITLPIIMFFALVLFASNCFADWKDDWTINGVPLNKFKNASASEYLELGAGIGSAFVIHWASHALYCEIEGIDWHQEGLTEVFDQRITSSQRRNFGWSGFVGQLTVGTIIKFTSLNDTMFGTGLHIGNFLEVSTYPLIHGYDKGDIRDMGYEKGDFGKIGHIGLTIWSAANLMDYVK